MDIIGVFLMASMPLSCPHIKVLLTIFYEKSINLSYN